MEPSSLWLKRKCGTFTFKSLFLDWLFKTGINTNFKTLADIWILYKVVLVFNNNLFSFVYDIMTYNKFEKKLGLLISCVRIICQSFSRARRFPSQCSRYNILNLPDQIY